MADPTVLITGASSGIGRALAHEFARDGYEVLLVARRADALEELARDLSRQRSAAARTFVADLTVPGSCRRLYERFEAEQTPIDVVVNNAGFGLQGTVAELSLERQLEMIQLNVASLTELTRLFLPGMIARGRGGILNVGSTAAFQPGPLMAVYYATKAYVLSFTEALAEEVAATPLRVSCLCPGPTGTEFAQTANMMKSRLFSRPPMDVGEVARAGFHGWKSRQALVIPGQRNRLIAFAVQRLLPRASVRRAVMRTNANADA
jgi:short-subunit dehydrogenase